MTIRHLLLDDLQEMREAICGHAAYSFSQDVQSRMDEMHLSSVALGARCLVSHTMVDKWRQGKARPNGKERMKELGMALAMDAPELDAFLYRNGYPRLYAKNPLDSAAKLLLLNCKGQEDAVSMYRELISRLGLSEYSPSAQSTLLETAAMSLQLYEAAQQGQMSGWFAANEKHFTADAKTSLPDQRLVQFIQLYIGDSTIHEMSVSGELPVTLKNLLYPIQGGKAVATRYLRDKLIAFGLYSNMTEEEMDTMLELARLRCLSDPASKTDMAILCAVRMAHERYPGFEYENLVRVVKRLETAKDPSFMPLLADYQTRLACAEKMMRYYDQSSRTEMELCFEEHYTSYSDRGVMDYVHDVLMYFADEGVLPSSETRSMIELLERPVEEN